MIKLYNLDIRTVTLALSLRDCVDSDVDVVCENIYNKITRYAGHLVEYANEFENDYSIPIVNKRISVTPISLVGEGCKNPDYVKIAKTLDKAAKDVGVKFIGGFSALVEKGMTKGDKLLIESIPQALSQTERLCSSVNVGSSKAGINMDAVLKMAGIIKQEVVENLGGDFADFSSMTEMYDNQYDLDTFFLEDYDKNYQLGTLLRQIDE